MRLPSGIEPWRPEQLLPAMNEGRVDPLTQVSFDGGATWTSAASAVMRIAQKRGGDAGLERIVPVNVEPRSVIAGYVSLASFLMFGGPISFVAAVVAADTGPKLVVRVAALLVGFVLGPLPIAAIGWWALRVHLADASKRGAMRAWFALLLSVVLALVLLGGGLLMLLRDPE